MTIPEPSQIRVVRINGERAPIRSRNLVGPTTRYSWPALYPLIPAWSWVDARIWCKDGVAERLLFPIGVGWSPADGRLLGFTPILGRDGMQFGLLPRIAPGGLARGALYIATVHLIGASTGKAEAFQIAMPTMSDDAIPPVDPTLGRFNGDAFKIAGIQIYTEG